MDTADEELEKTRALYMKKMKEFNERWRQVEKGQLEIKQNLVKFNNFVREKQGKVEVISELSDTVGWNHGDHSL